MILLKNNLKLLRGQIYKPLTFPYRSEKYYELGDEGLKTLEQIKKNFEISRRWRHTNSNWFSGN